LGCVGRRVARSNDQTPVSRLNIRFLNGRGEKRAARAFSYFSPRDCIDHGYGLFGHHKKIMEFEFESPELSTSMGSPPSSYSAEVKGTFSPANCVETARLDQRAAFLDRVACKLNWGE